MDTPDDDPPGDGPDTGNAGDTPEQPPGSASGAGGDESQAGGNGDGPDVADGAAGADGNDGAGGADGSNGADGADPEESGRRRRLLWLLLLLLLVLVGGGVGTYVLDTQPDEQPGVETPSAPPNASGTLTLATTTDATLLRTSGVVPGDEGTSRLVLRNTGDRTGELAVANVTVDGAENGLTTPEATAGDSTGTGELADALLVRLSVRYSDGETVRVFGGEEYVPLAGIETRNRTVGGLDADETVTVVFEWRLPRDTGNEVQGDTATFDIVFGLREPVAGTPGQ